MFFNKIYRKNGKRYHKWYAQYCRGKNVIIETKEYDTFEEAYAEYIEIVREEAR